MDNKKIDGLSLNKQKEILKFLKSDAPEIFSEGKIDCKKLKAILGEAVEDSEERYGLNWAGKSDCFRRIQEQTTATLKPSKEESVDFDNTGKLFIEGDNLEVLKVLQRSYYGQVKMIYIDPPYNTGNDFIYNDKFKGDKEKYLEEIGVKNGNGDLLRIDGLTKNTKDSGHYHSNWLNMMYPRLFLARNLLKKDGVIFVSIDDNEVCNLRAMMNEIFGEENYVETFIWRSRLGKGSTSTETATLHEYIVCYAKSIGNINFAPDVRINIRENKEMLRQWGQGDKREDRPSMYFPICSEEYGEVFPVKPDGTDGRWRASKESIQKLIDNNSLVFEKQEDGRIEIYRIIPAGTRTTTAQDSILKNEEVKTTAHGSKEIKQLFGSKIFDYPKPTTLIRFFLKLLGSESGLILDFFAGSGTTAHAVMAQNAEDGENRKFICIQLPELCEENSEAYKAGYKTITKIGEERIRRAGKKIEKETKNKIDLGFKVFRLDNSNFKIWRGKFKDGQGLLKEMEEFVDNVKKDSKKDNILYEVILKSGLDLNVKIENKNFDKEQYFSVEEGKLIIYLGDKINKELANEFRKEKPEKIVCLDRCFNNNDQLKTNVMLQMEQDDIDFKVI